MKKRLLLSLIAILALTTLAGSSVRADFAVSKRPAIMADAGNLKIIYGRFSDAAKLPEPVTLVLLGTGLAFVGLAGRRRLYRD